MTVKWIIIFVLDQPRRQVKVEKQQNNKINDFERNIKSQFPPITCCPF